MYMFKNILLKKGSTFLGNDVKQASWVGGLVKDGKRFCGVGSISCALDS